MASFIIFPSTLLLLTFVVIGVYCQDAEFGHQCSLTNKCRPDLTCVSERCECRHSTHQDYNWDRNRCESRVQGPCADNVDDVIVDIPCVPYAACSNETGFPECLCPPGTRQSGRSCRSEFGGACRFSSDCHNVGSFPDNALTCRNGICDCNVFEAYDVVSGRCIGLVGASCRSGYICVSRAECATFDESDWWTDGICRCTSAFMQTPDRRCQ